MPEARRLLPILGVVFIVMMGMGMMIPVLPWYAARFGGGSATVGLMLASFGTARLLASVPAGLASERFGRRPAMTAGILLLSASSFAAAFSASASALAACLFFQGLGSALYVTSAMAAVADRATPASRGRLMSSYQAALLLGVSVGPAIGGAVTDLIGERGPFLVQGTLALIGAGAAFAFLTDTRGASTSERGSKATHRLDLSIFRNRQVGVLALVMFGAFFTRTATNWQLVPVIARESFGFGPRDIGLLLTAGAATNLAILPLGGPAIDRWGGRLGIAVASVAVIAALLILGLSTTTAGLWTGMAVLGAASGMLAPACAAYALQVSPGGHGQTMGALRMAGDLGLIIGPVALGQALVGTNLSEGSGVLINAGLVVLVCWVFLAVTTDRQRGS